MSDKTFINLLNQLDRLHFHLPKKYRREGYELYCDLLMKYEKDRGFELWGPDVEEWVGHKG